MAIKKTFQLKAIGRNLKARGIDTDLIDLNAKIDSSLSLRENNRIIMEDSKYIGKNKLSFGTKSLSKMDRFFEAEKQFNNMSNKSKNMDLNKRAKNTFEMEDLNKKNYNKWKKNPNKYDIYGIDQ